MPAARKGRRCCHCDQLFLTSGAAFLCQPCRREDAELKKSLKKKKD